MYIKERVLQIAKFKGVAKQKFCEDIGSTYGNFTGDNKMKPIKSNFIANIILSCPEINPDWLLTGKGEMLRKNGIVDGESDEKEGLKDKIIELLEEKVERLEKELREKDSTDAGEITEEPISAVG